MRVRYASVCHQAEIQLARMNALSENTLHTGDPLALQNIIQIGLGGSGEERREEERHLLARSHQLCHRFLEDQVLPQVQSVVVPHQYHLPAHNTNSALGGEWNFTQRGKSLFC